MRFNNTENNDYKNNVKSKYAANNSTIAHTKTEKKYNNI